MSDAETPGDVAALILAGGTSSAQMQAAGAAQNRALTLLNHRPMLDYVVDAVRAGVSGQMRILVAGNVPTPADCAAVPGGASLVDTLLNGVAALRPSETRLLVVTADVPFLTGDAVADFLQRSGEIHADFSYPIVDAESCRKRFPEMRRTTLSIAEGTFTGGNLALLNPAFLREREAVIRAAYARRKSIVGLANLLGPALLARLAASRLMPRLLSIAHLEAAVSRALGGNVRARAVISAFPEVAADIDRPEDLEIARKWADTA